MKNLIASLPITKAVEVKTFTDAVVLFSFQYGYDFKRMAGIINMPERTFSHKVKMNTFTANETISVTEFMRTKIHYHAKK